jgi:hypothetical protein
MTKPKSEAPVAKSLNTKRPADSRQVLLDSLIEEGRGDSWIAQQAGGALGGGEGHHSPI